MIMISNQLQQLINDLIQVEFKSAYLYLAMATYLSRASLTGMGKWLQLQHDEERGHAQQLITYLTNRNGTVEIRAIPNQPVNFGSPIEVWKQVLAHEQSVTQAYQQAYDMALKAQDYQTAAILQNFLREQIDEEAQATNIVNRLQINQDNPAGLLVLDQELGRRAG